jgi:hypothetical protein
MSVLKKLRAQNKAFKQPWLQQSEVIIAYIILAM